MIMEQQVEQEISNVESEASSSSFNSGK